MRTLQPKNSIQDGMAPLPPRAPLAVNFPPDAFILLTLFSPPSPPSLRSFADARLSRLSSLFALAISLLCSACLSTLCQIKNTDKNISKEQFRRIEAILVLATPKYSSLPLE